MPVTIAQEWFRQIAVSIGKGHHLPDLAPVEPFEQEATFPTLALELKTVTAATAADFAPCRRSVVQVSADRIALALAMGFWREGEG